MVLALSLLANLPAAGTATAARNRISIHPSFEVRGWYDDNIDFTAEDKKSDYYAQISPGIRFDLYTRFFDLQASYTYTRYQYSHYKDKNRDYHQAKVKVVEDFEILKNVTLAFGDDYELVPVNVELPDDQPDNFTQKNRAYLRTAWSNQFSRINTLGTGYEFSRVDYTENDSTGENYWGHRFNAFWKGQITHWLTLRQDNVYRIKDYDDIPTYSEFRPSVSAVISLDENFKIAGQAGYSFEKSEDFHHRGEIYNIKASYIPSDKLKATATFNRDRITDITGSLYTQDTYDFLCRYHPLKQLFIEGNATYYQYKTSGRENKRLRLRGSIGYQLLKEVWLRAGYINTRTVDEEPEIRANRFYSSISLVF